MSCRRRKNKNPKLMMSQWCCVKTKRYKDFKHANIVTNWIIFHDLITKKIIRIKMMQTTPKK